MNNLIRRKIAFLCTTGVEQIELTSPWNAVKEAGAEPVLVSLKKETITGMNGDWEHADDFEVNVAVANADVADYDALVIPGGTLNADRVRIDEDAQEFVRRFFIEEKPVASICHGPWVLIDAGVAAGRHLTSFASIATDLRNAGAHWEDSEVVVDANLVTSRSPKDLDAFNAALIDKLS